MPSSSLALQKALFAALTTDVSLLAVLGGGRVHDAVPQPAQFPYVTFGLSNVKDADTTGSDCDEHVVTLHVWSRAAGRSEAHAIVAAIRGVVHDRALSLEGHRLVNLRHELSEIRRDSDGETYRGLVRMRAVTEPL